MLLTEKRPLKEEISFRGRVFYIDMAFNNILTVFEIIEDKYLSNAQKLLDTLYMLTGEDEFSPDYFDSMEKVEYASELQGFIFQEVLGSSSDKEDDYLVDILGNKFKPPKSDDKKEERTYDFKHDARYIYSSFLKDYQMDLYDFHDKLHWDIFLALFEGLSEDTRIKQIMGIRTRELPSGKGTEKEREELLRLKNIYKLPEREVD